MDSARHSTSQDRVGGEGNPKELDSQGTNGGSRRQHDRGDAKGNTC